jgi:hypothetical protein
MKKVFTLAIFIACIPQLFAQDATQYPSTIVNDYNATILNLVKTTPGYTPPVAARAFGYIGLTLFEAVQPGMPGYASFSGVLNEFDGVPQPNQLATYHWPTVANSALSTIVDSLFHNTNITNQQALYDLRDAYYLQYQGAVSPEDFQASIDFGVEVANHVFAYSILDGGYQCQLYNFPSSFEPPVGMCLWVPLTGQVALQPYIGDNRPFLAQNADDANLPTFLPELSIDPESEFYNYAYEVYETVNNATEEQLNIATWWADGGGTVTPPGHSIYLMSQTFETENSNLEEAAIVYAMLGMSLSDAFLACWKTKYIHNIERPITYIRALIDENWSSPVGTPPFPEYVSGHSSQSGAMASVMTHFFGDSYSFTDDLHGDLFGGPRSFNSFWEAADEAAVSRLYGGIHYEYSNTEGLYLGDRIGNNFLMLLTSVSTEDILVQTNTLKPYPNPTTGNVMFRNLSGNLQQVEVYNSFGSLIITENNRDNIDLSNLPSGAYLVRYRQNEQTEVVTQRIVKI